MPAKSKKQQELMAIAEHEPQKLYKRSRGVLKMTKAQLKEFAKTKRKGLPEKIKPKKSKAFKSQTNKKRKKS